MPRFFASATLFVVVSAVAVAQEDINGIAAATWNVNRISSPSSGSSRGNGDLQLGVISRFTIADVVEFDPFREKNQTSPRQKRLEKCHMEGIANVNAGPGFLVAHIPPKDLIVIGTHLKSSRGKSGKRDPVAAAIVDAVNELMEEFPQDTIFVLGDFDVVVTETKKNQTDLTVDGISGSRDKYNETHTLLKDGLVDDLRTKEALGR